LENYEQPHVRQAKQLMITIISGTNRPKSNTRNIADSYSSFLSEANVANQVLSLEDLPLEFAFSDLYGKRSEAFGKIMDEQIIPVQKMVVVMPEYNGTFPGILKLFFDAVSPDHLRGKKMALIGVAAGRAGNLRGIDQLTNAMHYMRVHIYPNHVPISMVRNLLDAEGKLTDEATIKTLRAHAEDFAKY
jgi:chromate reductase, NAD(P)H dehydrogenase (quinone)